MEKEQLKSLLEMNAAIASISDKYELYKVSMGKLRRLICFDDAVAIVLLNAGRDYINFLNIATSEKLSNPLSEQIMDKTLPMKGSPIEHFFNQKDLYEWKGAILFELQK